MSIYKQARIVLFTSVLLLSAFSSADQLAKDAVWIDVRSTTEHKLDNIEGDLRISHDEIVSQVSKLYPDKETEIYLYCASGGRAAKAQAALEQAGYESVNNAGSINDARKQRAGLDSK